MLWRSTVSCYLTIVLVLRLPMTSQPMLLPSPTPLRVCLVVEPSPLTYVSGYANRFHALLETLHTHDDHVELVTVEATNKNPPRLWKDRYPVHYARGMRLPWYPATTLSTDWTCQLLRTVWRSKPDLLHVTSPGLFPFPAILASRLFGIPLILSYHTHLPVYLRSYVRPIILCRLLEWLVWPLIRLVHSFSDLNIVTSPQILEEFKRHKIPRCQLWQKGIDTDKFHPKFRDKQMRFCMTNGHPDEFLMVYVGRLGSEKRLKDLRAVLNRMTGTRLCFVGTGPQEDELRQCFPDAVFLGQLTGESLSRAFASADVFCMPSDSETLGFVVLESMASGVPVVGVKAGGVPDLIEDGLTGFLVDPGDTDAFVDRLTQLKHDGQLRLMLSTNARKEMEKWSWQASMKKLRNIQYAEAMANFENRLVKRVGRLLSSSPRMITRMRSIWH